MGCAKQTLAEQAAAAAFYAKYERDVKRRRDIVAALGDLPPGTVLFADGGFGGGPQVIKLVLLDSPHAWEQNGKGDSGLFYGSLEGLGEPRRGWRDVDRTRSGENAGSDWAKVPPGATETELDARVTAAWHLRAIELSGRDVRDAAHRLAAVDEVMRLDAASLRTHASELRHRAMAAARSRMRGTARFWGAIAGCYALAGGGWACSAR